MPNVTISGAVDASLFYTTLESAPFAQNLADLISKAIAADTLTQFDYVSGSTAPGPDTGTDGFVQFGAAAGSTTGPVAIPVTDSVVTDSLSTPLSITGGAATGETVLAGSGGLTYTDITAHVGATDNIVAGDGNNDIESGASTVAGECGTGDYVINTGAGNDTISIAGNATINAGTGHNSISVTGGSSFISSEGYDTISGAVAGSVVCVGTDTVEIGSGQTTINPGASNFFIFGQTTTTNPLLFTAGTGSDTISVGSGGGDVTAGSGGNSVLIGGAGSTDASLILRGTADGDRLYAISAGTVTAIAGAGGELISGITSAINGYTVPGSTANNTFIAGSGNDTLIAGYGNDTLEGGTGSALMVSSDKGATTFDFQFGKGGQDTITGFKATDTLQLTGFNLTSAAAIPETTSGFNTVLSLSDGTTVTLQNVASLGANQVKLG